MPDSPDATPWGRAEERALIGDGIWTVTAVGGSGFWVAPEALAKMPAPFQRHGNWFEFPIDHNMVIVAFPEAFIGESVRDCVATLIDYRPALMREAGYVFDDSGSYALRQQAFDDQHCDDLVAVNVYRHENDPSLIPHGMVGVVALRERAAPRDRNVAGLFLVPEREYDARDEHGFVVDTARHFPLTAFPVRATAIAATSGRGLSL